MHIPENVKRIEHPMATFWFDDKGILFSVTKPTKLNIEIMEEYMTFIKSIVKDQKVCILTDISKASPMDKQTRDYTAVQLQHISKAMAIISSTPLGKTLGRIFLQLDGQPYPARMFSNEKEAKEWLLNYI